MRIIFASMLLLAAACQRQFDPAEHVRPMFDGARTAKMPAAKIAHGERLSWVLGCHGCHGKGLEGQLWDDNPNEYGIMWASNLTRAVPAMTDQQLRDVLVRGVHPKRKDLWVMPSELFHHLAPADLDALIAYLRTVPPSGDVSPDPKPGPRALREISSGQAKPAAQLVRELAAPGPVDLGPRYAMGRYITSVTCAECHGYKLEGHTDDEGATPNLVVAGGYSREEFERFLTTGVPSGNRKLKDELMAIVAKSRFSKMTRHERDALYAYLKARAERPQ